MLSRSTGTTTLGSLTCTIAIQGWSASSTRVICNEGCEANTSQAKQCCSGLGMSKKDSEMNVDPRQGKSARAWRSWIVEKLDSAKSARSLHVAQMMQWKLRERSGFPMRFRDLTLARSRTWSLLDPFSCASILLICGTHSLLLCASCSCVSDGVHTHRVEFLPVCLLRTLFRSRGRLHLKAFRCATNFARRLRTCPTTRSINAKIASSACRRSRRPCVSAFFLIWTGACALPAHAMHAELHFLTIRPNIRRPQSLDEQLKACTLAFNANDSNLQPVADHFEKGSFFVLLDNCANCTTATNR